MFREKGRYFFAVSHYSLVWFYAGQLGQVKFEQQVVFTNGFLQEF